MSPLVAQATATLLVSLRIAPVLAFAPPFTLLRIPATVRLLLALALAGWLVAGHPGATWRSDAWKASLPALVAGELFLGITLALALQLAFAALLTAGRVLDIQAGFGLAALVDPATRAPMPLAGTVLAYAAGALFFATGGPHDLLAIWAASIERVPLGAAGLAAEPGPVIDHCATVFLMAIGLVGVVLLVLFVLDLAIAFMSRTLPQMNVLLLGFQVKTIATLVMLPVALGLSGSLLAGLLRAAVQAMGQAG